jgi:hypothetical protein
MVFGFSIFQLCCCYFYVYRFHRCENKFVFIVNNNNKIEANPSLHDLRALFTERILIKTLYPSFVIIRFSTFVVRTWNAEDSHTTTDVEVFSLASER